MTLPFPRSRLLRVTSDIMCLYSTRGTCQRSLIIQKLFNVQVLFQCMIRAQKLQKESNCVYSDRENLDTVLLVTVSSFARISLVLFTMISFRANNRVHFSALSLYYLRYPVRHRQHVTFIIIPFLNVSSFFLAELFLAVVIRVRLLLRKV